MTPTIGATWRGIRDRFAAAGLGTAALDARLLVQHALGIDTTALIACERDPLPPDAEPRIAALIARRLAGEPVARILGHKEFYGLDFGLNAATLVPRPETEMLVAFGVSRLSGLKTPRLADLGTGTGCIALAILDQCAPATALGTDVAPEALLMARANADSLGLAARFATAQGAWFDAIDPDARFDLIVSNPPYIESGALVGLSREVRDFDPAAALDGGADGLAAYRVIAQGAPRHLVAGGALALEIGTGQGRAVAALLQERGFSRVGVETDLAGHDRMVVGIWTHQGA